MNEIPGQIPIWVTEYDGTRELLRMHQVLKDAFREMVARSEELSSEPGMMDWSKCVAFLREYPGVRDWIWEQAALRARERRSDGEASDS